MSAIGELFQGRRLMVILRGFSPERTVELAERAWGLGIELVEVPVQSEDGFAALGAAVEAARRPVGAGTVITPAQMRRVADMGAAFAVSPGLDLALVDSARQCGLAYLPGVGTASEVQMAAVAGLTHVKGFPAGVLGPGWFRAMRGPFPAMNFVATGGIDAGNATGFLDAGAAAVAVGSALEDAEQLPLLARIAGEK
ncbi:bifunctional 4-hydroxy-2-oxoglutarate aldolase/2-dehydro-3-deoxy-phosphogluconate aldolase [Actinomadura darangshiensis]|uniref:bifunctional 4-hydroxy-2-oxoglutarate aldolase/2-dehydro-3-deoxy-phosphogluconate aldolase n=1 Tax=Actinomadura darangshiensis TaxID=705336 RepID=UPI001FB57583|nr:bifunctional 4-hydroxy-2-oxoglutarate aldolase/2-dehydro-3-deoxy-phosphogluconate aldolase [Actinomadura darangshiensis]